MVERFMELFKKPVGYLLILSIFAIIVCTILQLKRTKNKKNYTLVSMGKIKNILFYCILICFFLSWKFTLSFCQGVLDETGAELDKHILLFLVMFFISVLTFLYSHFRRFFFNDKELIVYTILNRQKAYKWIEIIGVKKTLNGDLVIKMFDGYKAVIDTMCFNNVSELEKKMVEKGIEIKG